MSWRVDTDKSRVLSQGGTVVGARVVLTDGKQTRPLIFTRDAATTPVQFRRMLLGANGTPENPGGELRAWLDHLDGLNAAPITEDPL